jgi:hypothetical protein
MFWRGTTSTLLARVPESPSSQEGGEQLAHDQAADDGDNQSEVADDGRPEHADVDQGSDVGDDGGADRHSHRFVVREPQALDDRVAEQCGRGEGVLPSLWAALAGVGEKWSGASERSMSNCNTSPSLRRRKLGKSLQSDRHSGHIWQSSAVVIDRHLRQNKSLYLAV